MQVLHQDALEPIAAKRVQVGEHFMEHRTEAIKIAARVEGLRVDLFRAHVVGCAQRFAMPRKRVRRIELLGDAEIDQRHRAVLAQHNVGRLDVAVDDAVRVHFA